MTDQTIDLRSVWAILRRGRRALIIAALLGAMAAGTLAYLLPDQWRSTSVVLLPTERSREEPTARDTATQVEIVRSEVVLHPAGEALRPQLSAEQVLDRISVEAPTTDIVRITAEGESAARAEALARAVAAAHINYLQNTASSAFTSRGDLLTERQSTLESTLRSVRSELAKTKDRLEKEVLTSSQGRADATALSDLTAQEANLVLQIDQVQAERATGGLTPAQATSATPSALQSASPAERASVPLRTAGFMAGGSGFAVLVSSLILTVRGRRERTLRSRGELADSLGVPVVASLHARSPSKAAGWTRLLAEYSPEDIDRWALRQLLRLLLPDTQGRLASRVDGAPPRPVTATILALSGDSHALAVAPLLASYAAGSGLSTQLVAAQSHETAAVLWAACVSAQEGGGPRPNLSVHTKAAAQSEHGDLVVRLVVVDRELPTLILPGPQCGPALLAVSSGSATAQELARVAVVADDSGCAVDSLVVVNAEALDHTTGGGHVSERVSLPIRTIGPSATIGTAAMGPGRMRR